MLGDAPDHLEVLLDEQHRALLAQTRSSAAATSATSIGASPFVGSSTSRITVLVQERPGDRDHLLLAARERPGPLRGARSRSSGKSS